MSIARIDVTDAKNNVAAEQAPNTLMIEIGGEKYSATLIDKGSSGYVYEVKTNEGYTAAIKVFFPFSVAVLTLFDEEEEYVTTGTNYNEQENKITQEVFRQKTLNLAKKLATSEIEKYSKIRTIMSRENRFVPLHLQHNYIHTSLAPAELYNENGEVLGFYYYMDFVSGKKIEMMEFETIDDLLNTYLKLARHIDLQQANGIYNPDILGNYFISDDKAITPIAIDTGGVSIKGQTDGEDMIGIGTGKYTALYPKHLDQNNWTGIPREEKFMILANSEIFAFSALLFQTITKLFHRLDEVGNILECVYNSGKYGIDPHEVDILKAILNKKYDIFNKTDIELIDALKSGQNLLLREIEHDKLTELIEIFLVRLSENHESQEEKLGLGAEALVKEVMQLLNIPIQS